jgi:hypothetical protein
LYLEIGYSSVSWPFHRKETGEQDRNHVLVSPIANPEPDKRSNDMPNSQRDKPSNNKAVSTKFE